MIFPSIVVMYIPSCRRIAISLSVVGSLRLGSFFGFLVG
jgi:hypothetical protein